MTSGVLEPSAFFGTNRDWVKDIWGQGYNDNGIVEVKVPVQYLRHASKNFNEVYFEGGLRRQGDIWLPEKIQSTFVDRLVNKRAGLKYNQSANDEPLLAPNGKPSNLNPTFRTLKK